MSHDWRSESVLPTEAVEAAARAISEVPSMLVRYQATTALEAALPFLREQWMAELEQVGCIEDMQDAITKVLNADDYPDEMPVFVHRQDTET